MRAISGSFHRIDKNYLLNSKGKINFHPGFSTTFGLFRAISLLLTSIVFMLAPGQRLLFDKLGFLLFLVISSFIFVYLYNRAIKRSDNLAVYVLAESVILAIIVALTGGLDSPFIWYALNPVMIASAYLPFFMPWTLMSVYLLFSILEDLYFEGANFSLLGFFSNYLGLISALFLMALAFQIFSGIYRVLAVQSQALEEQQEKLTEAYNSLEKNHQRSKSLSDFQREAVACKNTSDVYRKLVEYAEDVFPLQKAAVLVLDSPTPFLNPTHQILFTVVPPDIPHNFISEELNLAELARRWSEPGKDEVAISEDNSWLSLPLRLNDYSIMAIFVGWLPPGKSFANFQSELNFFINFAQQTVCNIFNLKRTEQTMQRMTALYEAVETISSRDDIKEVIDLFAAYARALTGNKKVIFWLDKTSVKEDSSLNNRIYTVKGEKDVLPESYWYEPLIAAWSRIQKTPHSVEHLVYDSQGKPVARLLCMPVKSRSHCFGLLAALQPKDAFNTEEVMQTLSFMANLAAVAIERNIAELFSDKMLLLEEQNRIANEIHDSVSQNLFSVVYGAEAIIRQGDTLSPNEKKQILQAIRDVTAKTAKELRLLIYRLSPRHRGDHTFVSELEKQLNGLAELNQIDIDFNISGKEEYLNAAIRRAFYRIVKEATNNAIRHGKSKNIKVDLLMDPFESQLFIQDDGKGCDIDLYSTNAESSARKLGVVNMTELARSLQGHLNIESKVGEGTKISVSVPTSPVPEN
ncbi:GAF domain-containing sensor histidine kinase [Dethiobacter alkaliphilus]|uniref:histidine kinase n=1 Tax=Dethiobacter alkaliphilus AHT 1 TaxID=555088 RepID=C0GEE5_DETAL|nr:histidine kinase [Dethiobacter alkaliphilus]EEG78439.1 multi-sensor signal transduction histidine kinase [Dethiobacter alkaliphilus AHT 1]